MKKKILAATLAAAAAFAAVPQRAHAWGDGGGVTFCFPGSVIVGRAPWIAPWRQSACSGGRCTQRLQPISLNQRWGEYNCGTPGTVHRMTSGEWCVDFGGKRYRAYPCGNSRLCFEQTG